MQYRRMQIFQTYVEAEIKRGDKMIELTDEKQKRLMKIVDETSVKIVEYAFLNDVNLDDVLPLFNALVKVTAEVGQKLMYPGHK